MKAFPAKAWFRKTPWENLIQTVLRLERTVCKRDPRTVVCNQTEDASRIRKNPDIAARLRSFAYNTIRASGGKDLLIKGDFVGPKADSLYKR